MKKYFILVWLVSNLLSSFGQISNDCFSEANYQRDMDLEGAKKMKVGDNASPVIISVENALKKVIGCKFPYAPFRTVDGRELVYSKLKSDFIIINFNYLFCDWCTTQLDSLVKIKKASKKSISIVSFFANKKEEISHLIDKYKNDVFFVADADNYTMNYDLKSGRPLNFILDKNKVIIYAHRDISRTINPYLVE